MIDYQPYETDYYWSGLASLKKENKYTYYVFLGLLKYKPKLTTYNTISFSEYVFHFWVEVNADVWINIFIHRYPAEQTAKAEVIVREKINEVFEVIDVLDLIDCRGKFVRHTVSYLKEILREEAAVCSPSS